jgi:hypothetical protein
MNLIAGFFQSLAGMGLRSEGLVGFFKAARSFPSILSPTKLTMSISAPELFGKVHYSKADISGTTRTKPQAISSSVKQAICRLSRLVHTILSFRVTPWSIAPTLVLPHKAGTFDHRRRVTEFEHVLNDHSNGVTEDDETHFAEILEKHDLDRDPAQESRNNFEKWIRENTVNRGAHHHVFDPALAIRLVNHVCFEVASAEVVMPFHIFIVARKSDKSAAEKEHGRCQPLEACSDTSPFGSDRVR